MKDYEVQIRDRFSNRREPIRLQLTEMHLEAKMVCSMIERWGMVIAELDGEDSTGRSRSRRSKPSEIVEHACETAALAFAEFQRRGWVEEVDYSKLDEELD